eukprot:jgi/Chrzof1/12938/Cz07g13060.t1
MMLRYSSRAYGLATGVGPAGNTTVHAAAALSPNPSLRHACVDGNRKHQPSRQLYRHSQHYKGVPGHADLETSSSGPTLADGAGNSNGGGHAGNRNSRNNGDDGDSDDDGEQFLTSSKAVQPRWLTAWMYATAVVYIIWRWQWRKRRKQVADKLHKDELAQQQLEQEWQQFAGKYGVPIKRS